MIIGAVDRSVDVPRSESQAKLEKSTFMKKYLPRSFKRHFSSSGLGINLLAKSSVLFSSWIKPGVFFFHQGRCGSTVLASVLNQHPKLSTYGEIFERPFHENQLQASPENLLRAVRIRGHPGQAVTEAKFFECQHLSVLNLDIDEFVDCVKQSGYGRFIILNRRNYLKKVVSAEIGRQRGGKFHYGTDEAVPDTTINLDVQNVEILGKSAPIVEIFEYMDDQYDKLRRALAGDDVLELIYEEDIFNDPLIAYGKVCNWLGLKSKPATVDLRRANVRPLSEAVSNWDDVSRALAGTRYGWMVE